MPSETSLSDLPFLLARAHHGFRALADRTLQEAGLGDKMRPGMGSILFALFGRDGCLIKELVETLRIPNGTLTGILNAMEKADLVERRPSPADGRAFEIHLTPLGRSLEAPLKRRHKRVLATLHQDLTASEIATLQRLLGVVLDNIWADGLKKTSATSRA